MSDDGPGVPSELRDQIFELGVSTKAPTRRAPGPRDRARARGSHRRPAGWHDRRGRPTGGGAVFGVELPSGALAGSGSTTFDDDGRRDGRDAARSGCWSSTTTSPSPRCIVPTSKASPASRSSRWRTPGPRPCAPTEELRPDLVLLDIHLPDMSGLEVLRRLRSRPDGADLDILAITAAREVETVRTAMAGGVADYLIKPFPLRVFRERLESYAAQRDKLRRLSARQATVQDQQEVDRLLSARLPHGARTGTCPRGSRRRTLQLVADTLRDARTRPVRGGGRHPVRTVAGQCPPLSRAAGCDGVRPGAPPLRVGGAAGARLRLVRRPRLAWGHAEDARRRGRCRGSRCPRLQPRPGHLPRHGHHAGDHQADGGGVLRERGRRPDAGPARPPDRPRALAQRGPAGHHPEHRPSR